MRGERWGRAINIFIMFARAEGESQANPKSHRWRLKSFCNKFKTVDIVDYEKVRWGRAGLCARGEALRILWWNEERDCWFWVHNRSSLFWIVDEPHQTHRNPHRSCKLKHFTWSSKNPNGAGNSVMISTSPPASIGFHGSFLSIASSNSHENPQPTTPTTCATFVASRRLNLRLLFPRKFPICQTRFKIPTDSNWLRHPLPLKMSPELCNSRAGESPERGRVEWRVIHLELFVSILNLSMMPLWVMLPLPAEAQSTQDSSRMTSPFPAFSSPRVNGAHRNLFPRDSLRHTKAES